MRRFLFYPLTLLFVLLILVGLCFATVPIRPDELFAPGYSPVVNDCPFYNGNRFGWGTTCGGPVSLNVCHKHHCSDELCFAPRVCPTPGWYQVGIGTNGDAMCAPFPTPTETLTPTPTPTATGPEACAQCVPGNNTEVIFNDGGLFGASPEFIFDKTIHNVVLSGADFPVFTVASDPTGLVVYEALAFGIEPYETPRFVLARAQGTRSEPQDVVSGLILGDLSFLGWFDTGYSLGAHIKAVVNGTPSAGDVPTDLQFFMGFIEIAEMRADGDFRLPQKPNCSILKTDAEGDVGCAPTPTPTETVTPTLTATTTSTVTPTPTPTVTPTATAESCAAGEVVTGKNTDGGIVCSVECCRTVTPTPTATATDTPTVTPTPTVTDTPTSTPTVTDTPTPQPSPVYFWFPFPSYVGTTGNATRPGDGQCVCWLAPLGVKTNLVALDTLELNVGTLDADDTLQAGVYSEDGQTRYFQCTVPVTATGISTCTNGDAIVPLSEGNYWFCFGEKLVTSEAWQIRRARGDAPYRIASKTITCTGGTVPATFTPGARVMGTTNNPPYVWFTDD